MSEDSLHRLKSRNCKVVFVYLYVFVSFFCVCSFTLASLAFLVLVYILRMFCFIAGRRNLNCPLRFSSITYRLREDRVISNFHKRLIDAMGMLF